METRYYRCIRQDVKGPSFIYGNIYRLVDDKTIDDFGAFIDELGTENGWSHSGDNYKYLKPVSFDEYMCAQPKLPLFLIGNIVSTTIECKVSCEHKRIGVIANGHHSFSNETICDMIFNKEENEWWYRTYLGSENPKVYRGNWYSETGLVLEAVETVTHIDPAKVIATYNTINNILNSKE